MAVGSTFALGPGTLKIGLTASPTTDFSALVNNVVITASKDQGDSVTKLSGLVKAGAVSYTYEMSGNVDQDLTDAAGLHKLANDNAGKPLYYDFMPNTVSGTKAIGQLIIDPLDFGGDTMGETMASDFAFALVAKPTYTYGTGTLLMADEQEVDADAEGDLVGAPA